MGNVFVLDHPLIQHKLTFIRAKETTSKDFRDLVDEITMLMVYEITRELTTKEIEIETPVAATRSKVLAHKIGFVPILRAGLGMINGLLKLIPTAKVGHIGLYRDEESFQPVHYYAKLPVDMEQREVVVIDPMLATGGTASTSIQLLKDLDISTIRFMCLIAAPEGVQRLQRDHPDVDIYTAAVDQKLNEKKFIVPGLGDAGDRMFGTNEGLKLE